MDVKFAVGAVYEKTLPAGGEGNNDIMILSFDIHDESKDNTDNLTNNIPKIKGCSQSRPDLQDFHNGAKNQAVKGALYLVFV